MKGNKRRDTQPELAVRHLLHAQGLRYRVDFPLPFDRRRTADIAFTKKKVAVFIDGCFWHGCPTHFKPPTRNRDFWVAKITGNRERDTRTSHDLEDRGWLVLRYWTHESVEDIVSDIAWRVASPAGRATPPRPEGSSA